MFVHMTAPPGVAMDRPGCVGVLIVVTMMMIVFVVMLMTMMMVIGVAVLIGAIRVRIVRKVAPDEESQTESGNQQSGGHSEPWVELLRHDPLRGVERDDAERVYGNRVGRGHDGAQQHR